jgi:3-hydroxyacyl-CoA dehydrogenase
MGSLVSTRLDQGVAVIEIDNPPVNALTQPLRAALRIAVEAADLDPSIRAIVLIGAGRHFVAGAEISELDNPPLEPVLVELLGRIERCGKPVVAAIAGYALGGGLELALAADLRVAASDAHLGLPEIKLGLMPGAGGTQRLPRLIGSEAALNLMLSGEPISAAQAAEIGLVDHTVPVEQLRAAALNCAREIASSGQPIRRLCDAPAPAPASEPFLAQQRKRAEKLSRGLVSPARMMESVAAASTQSFGDGLALSRRLFEECRVSESSRALRHLFFAERAAGRIEAPTRPVEHVAVIGAGTMGTGIAISLADAGVRTSIVDPDEASLARGRERFVAHYAAQV